MTETRIDGLARVVASRTGRRHLLGLGLSSVLGVSGRAGSEARNRRKKRKKARRKSPVLNEFGCVNVGQACRGKDALCCSGICQGKKPKTGEKDRSRCAAHGAGGCSAERGLCAIGEVEEIFCNRPSGSAICLTTTGNAPFCADLEGIIDITPLCRDCGSDNDCLGFGFPPGSACVVFRGSEPCDQTCPDTDGRACMVPAF